MIRRTLRRAQLPICYSSGFHPQMKCSFGPAVSVGYESNGEYCDIELSKKMEMAEVAQSLRSALPRDFALQKVARIPLMFPSLEAVINNANYWVQVPAEHVPADLELSLQQFLAQDEIVLEKNKNTRAGNKRVRVQVKPLLQKIFWTTENDWMPGKKVLELSLKIVSGQNVKPEKAVGLYLNLKDEEVRNLRVLRRNFFIEKQDGTLSVP